MIDKILLAVDGSKNSQRAIEIAAELAGRLKVNLFIVHVLMHGRPPEELVRMVEVEHLVEDTQRIVSPSTTYEEGSHLTLLRGINSNPKSARLISVLGEQIVEQAKNHCAEHGLKSIKTQVRSGDYAGEILKAAEENSADMIVIGSRGLGRLKSAVLGSVSQKVLHHADCSVLTVR